MQNRTLGDLENIADDTVDSKVIPSIATLPTFALNASKLKKLVSAFAQASPLNGVLAYHARAESFANSMPEDHALQVLQEIDEAEGLMWIERVKSQEIGAVIQAVFQKRAHV